MDLEKFKQLEELEKERRIRKIINIDYDYIKILKVCNAFWTYNEKSHYHALLSSGKHSDGYIDCSQVLKYTNLRDIFAQRMVEEVLFPNITVTGTIIEIDYVVSSSMAAITIGDGVATYLNSAFIYTEKINGVQKLKRFEIPSGAKILQVEELVTTLKTSCQVTQAILERNKNVEFIRDKNGKIVVLTLVHRPKKLVEYPNYQVLPLIEMKIHNWNPKECPLCRDGSKALPPKSNWKLFFL